MALTFSSYGSLIDVDEDTSNGGSGISLETLLRFIGKIQTQMIIHSQVSNAPLKGTNKQLSYVTGSDGNMVWQRDDFPPLLEKAVALAESGPLNQLGVELGKLIANVMPYNYPGTVQPGSQPWGGYAFATFHVSNGRVYGIKIQACDLTNSGSPMISGVPIKLYYAVPFNLIE